MEIPRTATLPEASLLLASPDPAARPADGSVPPPVAPPATPFEGDADSRPLPLVRPSFTTTPPPADGASTVGSTGSLLEPTPEPAPPSIAAPALLRDAAEPSGVSFAELWPEGEQDMVREVEEAIRRGRYWRAIELCETLVSRVLAGAAGLFGTTGAPRDAAVVPMLLGLDGRRYLSFRSVVREARGDGLITAREALAAYAFAIDCRLARSSIH